MFFCVLIEFHPMVGLDLHKDMQPPPLLPPMVPFAPHVTAATLNWVLPASTANTVRATWAHARIMQRLTDIQSFVPHIPITPAALLSGILTIFSGSKSYWGPSSVLANGSPIAVAELVYVNNNLNCGDIPTPSGYVIAPNTVVAGMTWGDFFGGLFQMFTEAVIQAALNALTGLIPGDWGGSIAGLFLGSPLGFSFNGNGTGPVGAAGRFGGMLGGLARSLGEDLGGDHQQATADRKALGEQLDDENKHPDFSDWNLLGSGSNPDGKRDGGAFGSGRTDKQGDAPKLAQPPAILGGLVGAGRDAFSQPASPPASLPSAVNNAKAEQF